MVAKNSRKEDVQRFAGYPGIPASEIFRPPRKMKPAPHIIPAIKALLSGYPDDHVARVVDAVVKGPRVSTREIQKLCSVSRQTVWNWIHSGRLPRPRKDGRRLNTWSWDEVKHLI